MKNIINLFKKNAEIIRYVVVGLLTTIVSFSSYYIITITILNPNESIQLQIANILSWIICVTFAYIMNRTYVFKNKNKNKSKQIFSFYGARILTLVLDMLMMFILVTILNINDKLSKITVQVFITISNYILSKFYVFKK